MSDKVVEVITTAPDADIALRIGREAVRAGLCACAQVSGPVTSVYVWKGETCEESEWRLEMKSFSRLAEALEAFIRERHPYEVPEILVREAAAVSTDYLDWMKAGLVP
jgi:periplasmic divalent cation tolerance protein